ncbi:MAG: translation initiation factor IF-2 [Desulfovibrio sp.]|uniref:translation initiation factor IF-2 n=1 Tax=Desulfovibrio sp. TaxID=885 RepID=UPI001A781C4E|nr:translation initiation factor IF-2 [Desulfovibrio sp.]MBD5417947.1 translation initiation factor IF-2 [Desulfovibrio sp.]
MGLTPASAAPAPWRFWALCGALFCLLGAACPALAGAALSGASPPPGAVTEVMERPFPLLVPLSYRWARGAAWMSALITGAPALEAGARRGLADAGLADRGGLLALSARLHSIGHLTPDDSPELAVAVRLAPAPDMPQALAGALREAELLALLRALLLDMESTLLAVRRSWPATLAEARKHAPELDAASQRLEALWRGAMAAREAPGGWMCAPEALPALERAVRGAPDNAALWLLLAEARLQGDLPQGAVTAAGEALGLLAGAAHPADARLEARARYVRGLGHWRLGQPALAEADLDAALRDAPPESAPQGAELTRRLRARGAVRLLRRNAAGMCEDFAAACALGDCEGLAAARARGHCRGGADGVDGTGTMP